jgi:hypothetical protein
MLSQVISLWIWCSKWTFVLHEQNVKKKERSLKVKIHYKNHDTWVHRHNNLFACPWLSKKSSTISFNFELVCLSLHVSYEIQKLRYWIINKAPRESKSILWWFVYTQPCYFFPHKKKEMQRIFFIIESSI